MPTAAVINFLVTHSEVDDELGYEMTKALWENVDALVSAHAAAKGIKPEQAVAGMPVPLHPEPKSTTARKGMM